MGIFDTTGVLRRVLLVAAVAGGLSGCAAQFSNHGYIPPEEDLDGIVVGVDTRASVEENIGVPVMSGVVNESGYYYVRSRQRTIGALRPQMIDREVLAISFNSAGVVQNIERFGLERGQVVPLARRVTTSGVGSSSFLRQLLGNIGRFNPAGLAG
jgi:outer membrane protein assembly factor BamE (lipoprotein component of BamABCDE complex)